LFIVSGIPSYFQCFFHFPESFSLRRSVQDLLGAEIYVISGHKVVFHRAPEALPGQTVAAAVKVAVVTGTDLVSLQQVYDLSAEIALIERRIMEEAELFALPCCLQGCLQTEELPLEDLFVGAVLLLLEKPATGAAKGYVAVEAAVVVK